MNLRQGTLLKHGEYRIERELGHGGFGITYLAVQTGLNRRVAIKEFFMSEYCERDADTSQVSLGTSGSRETVERFRNKFIKEAQNIACLKHPHIISIHDVFEDNGTAYYVMEYLEYGSLADLVKRQGRLSEADALRYTRQIADALRYIHERKMNHLDVKPGNILIDETDHAVLIDFGLSKRYDDEGNQTSTTPVGISHGYAPLEQYKKSGVGTFSPATDIYSLGATLYKLITGATPPDANDVSEDGLPPFPSFVSSTVVAAIEQAMQPRRKDRPQSVDAFLALLDAETKVDDERTVLDGYPLRPSGSSPLKRDSAALAEEDVEDKHSKKALSPFKGDADAKGASVTTKEALASPRSPRRGSGARHNVAEGVNNEAEPTPIWKKLLLPAVACIAVVLTVVLWPKGGDTSNVTAPTSGKINGHEYVDLGLSVKWATCNLGASSPSDYGNYYAWGETEEKGSYTGKTYKYWSDKDGDGYDDLNECQNIGSNISGTSYDVAHVKWGGSWRMPTLKEIKELRKKCSWEWTEVNGIKGQKVTGPNGNSIFLPAAGYLFGTEVNKRGLFGNYWSGTLGERYSYDAYVLYFGSDDHDWHGLLRCSGHTVRPVSE